MGEAALALAQHLGEMKPDQAEVFTGRAEAFQKRLLDQVQKWQQRLQQAGITKVVTYHRTLNYFLTRFGIEPAAYLEPKPGIPPTAQHILQVIRSVREQHIPLILIENYYDTKVAERVSQEVEQVEIRSVSVAVGGQPGLNTLEDLYEHLVQALEGAK